MHTHTQKPNQSIEVTCRPANKNDRSSMEEITRFIWDGEDYVPHVWEDWLDDPVGLLAVAEHDKRVLGFGKLTQLTERDWWMEGLRVNPDFQSRGIASQLHDYLLEFWEKHGQGTIRLATSSERIQVHRLCQRTGFQHIGETSLYKSPTIHEKISDFKKATPDHAQEILAWIRESEMLRLNYGLMDLGWQWTHPSLQLVESAIKDGCAFWWTMGHQERDGLVLIWKEEYQELSNIDERIAMIKLITTDLSKLKSCLNDFQCLASHLGYTNVGWLAPHQPEILTILADAGFKSEWDGSLYIFAKEHPQA